MFFPGCGTTTNDIATNQFDLTINMSIILFIFGMFNTKMGIYSGTLLIIISYVFFWITKTIVKNTC